MKKNETKEARKARRAVKKEKMLLELRETLLKGS